MLLEVCPSEAVASEAKPYALFRLLGAFLLAAPSTRVEVYRGGRGSGASRARNYSPALVDPLSDLSSARTVEAVENATAKAVGVLTIKLRLVIKSLVPPFDG